MSDLRCEVSAPGSLMLLGEHAVLYGRRAVVASVDKRIRVRLRWREDNLVKIKSAIGSLETELSRILVADPFRFVCAALLAKRDLFPSGLDLDIDSDFSSTVGLGSSAAVTVATVGVLEMALGRSLDRGSIFDQAYRLILKVQEGVGSGADVAASVYGGIIHYRSQPLMIERLGGELPPIVLVYSGHKTPTPDVIRRVGHYMQRAPELLVGIYDLMDRCVTRALGSLERGDWGELGLIFNINHGLMGAIGVDELDMAKIAFALRSTPGIFGAKISGSGLGDCIVGLGSIAKWEETNYRQLDVKLGSEGVRFES